MKARWLNLAWKHNPVTRVVYANAQWEMKLIALSLILLFLVSVPLIFYKLALPNILPPNALYYFFAFGALLANIGFVVGLTVLLSKHYGRH